MRGQWPGARRRRRIETAERADENDRLRRELEESQAALGRLQRLVDDAPVGLVEYAADGRVRFLNRRVRESTGATTPAEFDVLSASIVHPDDVVLQDAAKRAASDGRLVHFQYRVVDLDGVWRHVDGSMLPTFADGRVESVVAVFRNVDHQVEQVKESLRFRTIAEVTTDIVGIADLRGRVIYLNPAGHEFFGTTPDSIKVLARIFENIPSEYHRMLTETAQGAALRGEVWQGDLELIRATDLARVPMSAVVVGVPDESGAIAGFAVTYRDVSERREMERALAHAAAHDSLTGLANREELFRSLEVSLTSGAPTAVLFFDLDDFKVVNDSLGHAAGDDVLRLLAQRIRDGARGTDVVGRLGGDEFLVICRGVSRSHDAIAIADKILRNVTDPMDVGGLQHGVTGSIGVSLSRGRATTAATLIQEADIAMYRAKRAGRKQAMLFDDSMRVEAIDRLELDRDLRLGLERDEFELYFQPLVYFDRDAVQNFEALVRWNHPRHGLLMPNEFLPMVEQVGLTNALGDWVFDRAARSAAALRLIEPHTCVGVNVHPDQLRQKTFVADVTRAMLAARVTGEALTIEITEHAVMVDVDQTRFVLEELRAIGLAVAIDDFGTGYSNLDLLRRLPVDYLKIDRSFVAGLGIEPGDTQLVRMIVGLAIELGIEVIGEGIETQLQASELRRLGCRIGQGYLYSRPLTLADATEMLRRQQASPPSSVSTVPVM